MRPLMTQTFLAASVFGILFALAPAQAHAQSYYGEYSPGSPSGGGRSYSGGRSYGFRQASGFYGNGAGGFYPGNWPGPAWSIGASRYDQARYSPVTVAGTSAVLADESNLATNAAPNTSVQLNLLLPADTQVWFDGAKTRQTGTHRAFLSPPLEAGRDYSYNIRVQWLDNGREVTSIRKIGVHAGDRINLTFPEAMHASAK